MKPGRPKKSLTAGIATVHIEGMTLKVDVDEAWKRLLSDAPQKQVASISTGFHFLIHLGCMALPYAIKTRFLSHYSAPKAIKARDIAIDGLVAVNHERELHILEQAGAFHHNLTTGKYRDDDDRMNMDMLLFAVGFAEVVYKRDAAALRRMINIIEAGRMPPGERGGVGSADGYMLEKFCELHLATRSLPTKKRLRNECGLGGLENEKIAAKRMKKLGLWGLPTEPEI
ncbi:MAG: hypothetical protein NTW21_44185 [Verrucomicrobia bacterium]|nr:hypothetical protein [Verrucomicrobiota bacterium]